MGMKGRVSWLIFLCWVLAVLCLRAHGEVAVKFLSGPQSLTSTNRVTFRFQAVVEETGQLCRNCSFKCKLDNQTSLNCEARKVSYTSLRDGNHTFEVCANGSHGVSCASYDWTVDTVPPTAYVSAESSFTNALNVSVDISFSKPCIGGGGFRCSSVNSCNLLVYGAGQVIPSTFKILQPNLKFSLLVGLSVDIEYGRLVLVMDKDFCTDTADRRNVYLSLRTHIPEKLIQLNNAIRMVEATNSNNNLKVYLYFSEPVLNSSAEIQSVIHTTTGFLLPSNGKTLGNRRFSYLLQNVSGIAIVTVSVHTSSIISRQGTPVLPTDSTTFLYDSRRPSVKLSTTRNQRTNERTIPVIIKFGKPVFEFKPSDISVLGGHLLRFHQVNQRVYVTDIHADADIVSVDIPENVTRDVAGNRNFASNILHVKHYSASITSILLSTIVTTAFGITAVAAGLLTISTASLQSLGTLARPSSLVTSEPTRNIFRIASHIQIFALSKWLSPIIPVEYYEFVQHLQWVIPHLHLPWESGYTQSIMVDNSPLVSTQVEVSENIVLDSFKNSLWRKETAEIDATISGLPLTPMEYMSYFESQNISPEADIILDLQSSNGWKQFNRNLFWLALIAGVLLLLHIFILSILKFRRKRADKQKNYGPLVLPRFEIFLIILALPCLCQASAAVIRGGSTSGIVVGILLLGVVSFLLLSLLLFVSIGITLGKLLQYKEVHQEGQQSHWYQDIVRVTLGPGKRGQWTWKNQPNSVHLAKLGPLFEDLRGPPKFMLSQIASTNSGKRRDQIIASDDETEDAQAPFIQKLFGILRIYYTLLESVRRVALGIVSGANLDNGSAKFPALIVLCITAFQLLFLVLKKPFIKKKVQLVEIISVAVEVGILATCLALVEKEFSTEGEKRIGIFMLLLCMIGFIAQMGNEWYALYKQVLRLSPVDGSFCTGLKMVSVGLLLFLIPWKLLKNWDDNLPSSSGEREAGETGSSGAPTRSSGSSGTSGTDRPWLKQLRALARASFSKEDGGSNDPSGSQTKRGFWSGKRSGSSSMTSSSDSKAKSQGGLYKDFEAIFSTR
ncbi:uncharacterized protein [Aristolochia californica]|uniref:uncharacterized protein isoform X2 n=1 Tax=Aristolochia californica TaxID=171875 RepID=UPI0035DBD2E3